MTRLFTRVVGVILLISLISGCVFVPKHPDEPVAVVFHGDIDTSSSGLHMDGYLYTIGSNPEKRRIEDVNICLYDENLSLTSAHAVGESTPRRATFPFRLEVKPFRST